MTGKVDNDKADGKGKDEKSPGSKRLLAKISLTALFAALIAAGAFLIIPVGPVPIAIQNLLALLAGLVLGPVLGAAAVGLYLLAGILNLPVFAGGTGGIARFAGPTGGYLVGYLFAAVIAGLIAGRPKAKTPLFRIIMAVIAGFLIIYVPGVAWLKISRNLDWTRALVAGFTPFIIGDILKGIAAVFIAPRLRRIAAGHLNEQ